MRCRRSVGTWAAVGVLVLAGCGDSGTPSPSTPSGADESARPTATTEATSPGPAAGRPGRDRSGGGPTDRPTDGPSRDPLADAVEGLSPFVDEPVLGADISWPQCPVGMGIPLKRSQGAPPPVEEARYVVVGLTNGPGFYPNPCLAEQVADVRARGRMAAAYSVVSHPEPDRLARHADDGPFDGSTRLGALANNGYAQAAFNVRTMRAAGLLTPVVWIDVEPVPDFEWTTDLPANAAVVEGMARGYRDAGYRIGVYSTPYLWDVVVGDLALGVPEWRAAGQTSRDAALATCAPDRTIQGGDAVMGQWVEAGRDMNVTCPGISLELETWFHQY
jgi:hypothetical protein